MPDSPGTTGRESVSHPVPRSVRRGPVCPAGDRRADLEAGLDQRLTQRPPGLRHLVVEHHHHAAGGVQQLLGPAEHRRHLRLVEPLGPLDGGDRDGGLVGGAEQAFLDGPIGQAVDDLNGVLRMRDDRHDGADAIGLQADEGNSGFQFGQVYDASFDAVA